MSLLLATLPHADKYSRVQPLTDASQSETYPDNAAERSTESRTKQSGEAMYAMRKLCVVHDINVRAYVYVQIRTSARSV